MKELYGTARNLCLVESDGKYVPAAELILNVAEPKYTVKDGKMVFEREYDTLRFATTKSGLVGLLELITETATALIELEKQAEILNKGKP